MSTQQVRQTLRHLRETARYDNPTGKPFVGGHGFSPCCPGQECQTQRKAAERAQRAREAVSDG